MLQGGCGFTTLGWCEWHYFSCENGLMFVSPSDNTVVWSFNSRSSFLNLKNDFIMNLNCSGDLNIKVWLYDGGRSPTPKRLVFFFQCNWAYDTLYFDQLLSRSNKLKRPWCLSQCAEKNKTRGLLDSFPLCIFNSRNIFCNSQTFWNVRQLPVQYQ